ncbi:MAG: hydantoinase/oxoprolinase family protein, partial [Pseudomonadota bacterium]
TWEKPEALVHRRHRLEVEERIGSDGSVVRPLNRALVESAAAQLVEEGVESIALCFINSYINAAHENEAKEIITRAFPNLLVTASCDVLPEIKEYERTSTTVVNAYLLPAMRTYIARLRAALREVGFSAPLLVVSSAGGMMGADLAAQRPVFAVGSGPAGGVSGAARLSEAMQTPDMVVFDMGGTTAKSSIVENSSPMLTSEYEFRDGISSPSRFIKGGGYMLKVPSIDIAEVGAGGGSIAWIDEGGLLRVGPKSAGADPGPVCYGRGNDEPTVTDANVVLGYLNPENLAGGSLKIDRNLAVEAIRSKLAEPLGLTVEEAALGIREVANVNMGRSIRSVTVERGRDPRDMALMAFGGSGPAHAADLARQLEMQRVVIPPLSGVFCSAGMLASDIKHKLSRSFITPLEALTPERFEELKAELAAEAAELLGEEGYEEEAQKLSYEIDLRYMGQSSELTVALPDGKLDAAHRQAIYEAFQRDYQITYGYNNEEPLEMVCLRLTAVGHLENRLRFEHTKAQLEKTETSQSRRSVCFEREQGYVDTAVVSRALIDSKPLSGPMIVETYDTTIIIPPWAQVYEDSFGSLIIERSGDSKKTSDSQSVGREA